MAYDPPIYPTSIPTQDEFTIIFDDLDMYWAKYHNQYNKEIRAIMEELGLLPKGTYDSVVARLNDYQDQIDARVEKTGGTMSGPLLFSGDGRFIDVIIMGIHGFGQGVAKPDPLTAYDTFGYGFKVNDIGFIDPFEIPYGWDTTTIPIIRVHWYCDNSSASKLVSFQVNCTATAEDVENIDAGTTALTTGITDLEVPETPFRLNESSVSFPADFLTYDDVVSMQIKRVAATGGAGVVPDNIPVIMGIEVEYISSKLGETI